MKNVAVSLLTVSCLVSCSVWGMDNTKKEIAWQVYDTIQKQSKTNTTNQLSGCINFAATNLDRRVNLLKKLGLNQPNVTIKNNELVTKQTTIANKLLQDPDVKNMPGDFNALTHDNKVMLHTLVRSNVRQLKNNELVFMYVWNMGPWVKGAMEYEISLRRKKQ